MIIVYTGPMFSGKSSGLVEAYSKIWNKANVLCLKPKIDNRDTGIIKSRREYEGISANLINYVEEIKSIITPTTKTIFIDEAQFLEGNPLEILNLTLEKDIDFHIAGLSLTAEQEPFGFMPIILAMADEINIYYAVCYDCNKKAIYTYYEGEKDVIKVGNEGYIPLCGSCLIKRKENTLKLKK